VTDGAAAAKGNVGVSIGIGFNDSLEGALVDATAGGGGGGVWSEARGTDSLMDATGNGSLMDATGNGSLDATGNGSLDVDGTVATASNDDSSETCEAEAEASVVVVVCFAGELISLTINQNKKKCNKKPKFNFSFLCTHKHFCLFDLFFKFR
jgi:hypothetical protein